MKRLLAALALICGALAVAPAGADPVYQSQTIACTHAATWSANGTPLVVSQPGKQTYVCGFTVIAGATAPTIELAAAATNSSCGALINPIVLPATALVANQSVVDHQPYYAGLAPIPTGDDLCGTAATGTLFIVYYTQF